MNIVDFSNCPYSDKHGTYGGLSGRKDGIIYNNENWLIKYPKNTIGMKDVPISYTTSPLNEYIGSHIYDILGYDVHETLLGIRNNKLVVACKDFEVEGSRLIEMRTIKNAANPELASILDRNFASTGTEHFSNIDELILHINNNEILTSIPNVEEHFWDMATVDLLIRNNDRNNGNWGILKTHDVSSLAPVFDNGGCFTDKSDDDKLQRLLNNPIESAINFRTSFGKETIKGEPTSVKQMNAKDFIDYAMNFDKFKNSLIKNIPLIEKRLNEIKSFIYDIPKEVLYNRNVINVCSDIQKEYFFQSLNLRLEHLLIPAYENVMQKENHILSRKMEAARKEFFSKPKEERTTVEWEGKQYRITAFEDLYLAQCKKENRIPDKDIVTHFNNNVAVGNYTPQYVINNNRG